MSLSGLVKGLRSAQRLAQIYAENRTASVQEVEQQIMNWLLTVEIPEVPDWKPDRRCREVLRLIQTEDLKIQLLWSRYKRQLNQLEKHGWIRYRLEGVRGIEDAVDFEVLKQLEDE